VIQSLLWGFSHFFWVLVVLFMQFYFCFGSIALLHIFLCVCLLHLHFLRAITTQLIKRNMFLVQLNFLFTEHKIWLSSDIFNHMHHRQSCWFHWWRRLGRDTCWSTEKSEEEKHVLCLNNITSFILIVWSLPLSSSDALFPRSEVLYLGHCRYSSSLVSLVRRRTNFSSSSSGQS
jgi:hypothetical protein